MSGRTNKLSRDGQTSETRFHVRTERETLGTHVIHRCNTQAYARIATSIASLLTNRLFACLFICISAASSHRKHRVSPMDGPFLTSQPTVDRQ